MQGHTTKSLTEQRSFCSVYIVLKRAVVKQRHRGGGGGGRQREGLRSQPRSSSILRIGEWHTVCVCVCAYYESIAIKEDQRLGDSMHNQSNHYCHKRLGDFNACVT